MPKENWYSESYQYGKSKDGTSGYKTTTVKSGYVQTEPLPVKKEETKSSYTDHKPYKK